MAALRGVFNILPDRGYNNNNAGGFFSDYAARIQQVGFGFTPYTGTANIGGTEHRLEDRRTESDQLHLADHGHEVHLPRPVDQYAQADDRPGSRNDRKDHPSSARRSRMSRATPARPFPALPRPRSIPNVNKLALDSEALVLKPDGSGYIGDEYGANVYYFNANKEIVGVITPPAAMQPRKSGSPDFNSLTAVTDGRRNNQGFEGVS